MTDRDAALAVRRAATLRAQLGYAADGAACPFDVASRLGVEVRLVALPSLEGMYEARSGTIFVSSQRPAGRRRYTCAHELGHHVHGHGTSFDAEGELASDRVEERIANVFARAMLMPKLAVASAFARRGWQPRTATPIQVFVVSQDLGVGFTTLVDHMQLTLSLLDARAADALTKARLPVVRASFDVGTAEHDVIPVDVHWGSRPLDVEVGDVVHVPNGARFIGTCCEPDGVAVRARQPGHGALEIVGRGAAIPVRVSRREFIGRAIYRHLEDVDDDA